MKRKLPVQVQEQNAYLALETLSSNYLAINKTILSKFGPSYTVYLINLVDKFKYFLERDMLSKDGEFFLTHAQQTEQTGMNEYELRKCKKFWTKLEIITSKLKGVPPKEFYMFNFSNLMNLLANSFKGVTIKNLKGLPFKIYRDEPLKFKGIINKPKYKESLIKEKNNNKKEKFDPLSQIKNKLSSSNLIELTDQETIQKIQDWVDYRQSIKKPIKTDQGVSLFINKFKEFGQESMIEAINASIEYGWVGLFPKKNTGVMSDSVNRSPQKYPKRNEPEDEYDGLRTPEYKSWKDMPD